MTTCDDFAFAFQHHYKQIIEGRPNIAQRVTEHKAHLPGRNIATNSGAKYLGFGIVDIEHFEGCLFAKSNFLSPKLVYGLRGMANSQKYWGERVPRRRRLQSLAAVAP